MAANKKQSQNPAPNRPIVTNYYGHSGKILIWQNRAKDPENAMDLAFKHMRRNHYGAFVAEVFNEETGELYSVVIHPMAGKIVTIFERDPATKVVVTDFDATTLKEIEAAKEGLDFINSLIKESRLEKRILEKVHG
jgi:hypothetical protein